MSLLRRSTTGSKPSREDPYCEFSQTVLPPTPFLWGRAGDHQNTEGPLPRRGALSWDNESLLESGPVLLPLASTGPSERDVITSRPLPERNGDNAEPPWQVAGPLSVRVGQASAGLWLCRARPKPQPRTGSVRLSKVPKPLQPEIRRRGDLLLRHDTVSVGEP
jgi:hypothetical protein